MVSTSSTPGTSGWPGKCPSKTGLCLGHDRLRRRCASRAVERDDAVDHLEVFEAHAAANSRGEERGRGGTSPDRETLFAIRHSLFPYAFFAATSSSIRATRFFSTKYCSAGTLPSLTSWVQGSTGSLMPKALSMAKAMSRKSRLSMPRSSITWLSGVIFSRGMSARLGDDVGDGLEGGRHLSSLSRTFMQSWRDCCRARQPCPPGRLRLWIALMEPHPLHDGGEGGNRAPDARRPLAEPRPGGRFRGICPVRPPEEQPALSARAGPTPRADAARIAACRRCGSIRARRAYRCGRGPGSARRGRRDEVISTVSCWRGASSPCRPRMRDDLLARQAERLPVLPRTASGSTPMPTRFERWMRSKLSAITARTPSRLVPLAAQSRDEPVPYSLPAKTTSGTPSSL